MLQLSRSDEVFMELSSLSFLYERPNFYDSDASFECDVQVQDVMLGLSTCFPFFFFPILCAYITAFKSSESLGFPCNAEEGYICIPPLEAAIWKAFHSEASYFVSALTLFSYDLGLILVFFYLVSFLLAFYV